MKDETLTIPIKNKSDLEKVKSFLKKHNTNLSNDDTTFFMNMERFVKRGTNFDLVLRKLSIE